MPKRKPVPIAPAPGPAAVKQPQASVPVGKSAHKLPFFGVPAWFAAQRQSRKYLILGIIAAVVIIALIIGLAVGLTVGKNGTANLPLPSSNGGPYSGDLTYYNPALGSCGYTNSDSDMICAVSHILFDAAASGSNPNENPLCGLKIRIRRNDKSVDVKVVDRCTGCAATDLDVTEAVFEKVANLEQGRVTMEWAWLEEAPVTA
ncbi:hypothetical protein N7470_009291 [Penicillium chermesinum]|nr:hypothetical protein N7470_009291 [Penicillium chermesinum]